MTVNGKMSSGTTDERDNDAQNVQKRYKYNHCMARSPNCSIAAKWIATKARRAHNNRAELRAQSCNGQSGLARAAATYVGEIEVFCHFGVIVLQIERIADRISVLQLPTHVVERQLRQIRHAKLVAVVAKLHQKHALRRFAGSGRTIVMFFLLLLLSLTHRCRSRRSWSTLTDCASTTMTDALNAQIDALERTQNDLNQRSTQCAAALIAAFADTDDVLKRCREQTKELTYLRSQLASLSNQTTSNASAPSVGAASSSESGGGATSAASPATAAARLDSVAQSIKQITIQHAPATGSFYVRLMLGEFYILFLSLGAAPHSSVTCFRSTYICLDRSGRVNVKSYHTGERLRRKQEYEKFRARTNIIFCLFTMIRAALLFYSPTSLLADMVESASLCWLLYYYASLALRENILKVNGSNIATWWISHHYISGALAATMVRAALASRTHCRSPGTAFSSLGLEPILHLFTFGRSSSASCLYSLSLKFSSIAIKSAVSIDWLLLAKQVVWTSQAKVSRIGCRSRAGRRVRCFCFHFSSSRSCCS